MSHVVVNAARPETREQRAWYWYDWANSAYVTTTATVLMSPYLTTVAEEAACPGLPDGQDCTTNLSVLGIPVAPGSLWFFTVTFTTILSAIVLIFIGAIADRSPHPTRLLGGFAWAGALAASLMFFVAGTNWQLGAALVVIAGICLGASLVIYDSILCRIANENERDRVSSKGWAFGYLGGGTLLALNFALDIFHEKLGLDRAMSTRISILSAGVWWAGFTIIPYLGLRHLTGTVATPVDKQAGVVRGSLGQLRSTFGDLRHFPQTLTFLIAYLFFNDGIQTVIGSSSIYGSKELGFSESTVLGVFLFVQFVAFFGARLFGRVAASIGAWRTVLYGIVLWTVEVAGRLPRARPAHRHRARWHPGAVALALQPAHPAWARGGVLQPLPGDGARHELARDADLRARLPADPQLPLGDHLPHRLLRRRRLPALPGRHASGHHRSRQPDARCGVTYDVAYNPRSGREQRRHPARSSDCEGRAPDRCRPVAGVLEGSTWPIEHYAVPTSVPGAWSPTRTSSRVSDSSPLTCARRGTAPSFRSPWRPTCRRRGSAAAAWTPSSRGVDPSPTRSPSSTCAPTGTCCWNVGPSRSSRSCSRSA